MEKVSKEKKSTKQLNTGIYISGGDVQQSDYDTTDPRIRMQDYTDMRNGDCIAPITVDILSIPLQNATFKVEPSILNQKEEPTPIAKEAADYVAWTYDNLECGLDNYVRHKLLGLHFGLALFEQVWSRGETYNGKIVNQLVDLSPIQPDTINRFKFEDPNDTGKLTGIEFYNRKPERGESLLTIPMEYLHLWTPFGEFNNPWGRSLLIAARELYKYKSQIWKASARAASRGAGIPELRIVPSGNDTADKSLKSNLETIARNVGNSENAYVITQRDRVEFQLHTLANQEMNLQLIQQANREMFYNTLSEFVTSGIGENGSRAATSEHKGPYFEMIDTIKNKFEDDEYYNIEKIIEQSPYYGKLDESEYPKVVLERAKDADIDLVLSALNQLTRTPEDEIFIRNVLGLPEISKEELIQIKEENKKEFEDKKPKEEISEENPDGVQETEDTEKEVEELKAHHDCHKLSAENDIFELKSATEAMALSNDKAMSVVDDVITKAIEDVAMKLQQNPNKKPALAYKKELNDRLESVFNQVFENGVTDVRKEYAKIGRTELDVTPIKFTGSKGKLSAKVDTLYTALENSIRDELELLNKQNIENAGGMAEYITGRFSDTQKAIKTQLASIASGGYLSGRNDALVDIEQKDPEVKRRYETRLEAMDKICEVCNPYSNMLLTKEQAEYVGLNWEGAPLNPLCLGGSNCKCTWVPAYSPPDFSKVGNNGK